MLPIGKSRTQTSFWRQDHGFTLMELMVVLVIIGIMSSFVILNLPAGKQDIAEEAEHIAARFTLAAREAVLRGETIGIIITQGSYRFVRRSRGSWHVLALNPGTQSYDWPENATMNLFVGGERQLLPRNISVGSQAVPRLYYTATSEASPFEIVITRGDETAKIKGTRTSKVMLEGRK